MPFETGRGVATTDQVENIPFENAHLKKVNRAASAWDTPQVNEQATILALSAFSGTQILLPGLSNVNAPAMQLIFRVFSRPGAETLTLFVDHYDFTSDTYVEVETSAVIGPTGFYPWRLKYSPTYLWRLRVVPSGGGTWIGSCSYSYLSALPPLENASVSQGSAGSDPWLIQGNVAHASADSGFPVKIGGRASATTPVPVTTGQRVNAWLDNLGRMVVVDHHASPEPPARIVLSNDSEQTLIPAPGSGLAICVTDMTGSNDHTVKTRVDLKEGLAGIIRYTYVMAPGGGGFAHSLKSTWTLPEDTALVVKQTVNGPAYVTVNYGII